jgi:hypothetical protein
MGFRGVLGHATGEVIDEIKRPLRCSPLCHRLEVLGGQLIQGRKGPSIARTSLS